MRKSNVKRRIPSWEEISEINKRYGWFTQLLSKNRIIFERGRQRIEIKKIPSVNKWKVEYYSGSIMDDTTGLENKKAAKIDAVEMGVLK